MFSVYPLTKFTHNHKRVHIFDPPLSLFLSTVATPCSPSFCCSSQQSGTRYILLETYSHWKLTQWQCVVVSYWIMSALHNEFLQLSASCWRLVFHCCSKDWTQKEINLALLRTREWSVVSANKLINLNASRLPIDGRGRSMWSANNWNVMRQLCWHTHTHD